MYKVPLISSLEYWLHPPPWFHLMSLSPDVLAPYDEDNSIVVKNVESEEFNFWLELNNLGIINTDQPTESIMYNVYNYKW